ncbi:hypothetical protein R6Q57_018422, partial [Mikania cordata]
MLKSRCVIMVAFKSVSKHNICAHLDLETPNARHYDEILTFLWHSRIFTAISTIYVPCISHLQNFWSSGDIDCRVEPPVIRGKVLGHDVVISAEHIRRVCGFQDSHDQPTLLDRYLVRGCFVGTSAEVGTSGQTDDMDLDTFLDLDFLTTTTASVSTPTEMAGTTSAEDVEGLAESYDSDDDAAGEGAGLSDSEDTPDEEFESVW